jgi:hypothetical protein
MGNAVVPNNATSTNVNSYPLATDGNYTYYAKQAYANSTFVSGCSTSTAFYPLNSEPTALKLLSTNPTSDPTPRILVEGVDAGDWVYLFQDPYCTSVSGSNIALGSSVQVQTLPALPSSDTYTYYAKRIQGGGQGLRSACSSASVNLNYNPSFFSKWELTNQLNMDPQAVSDFFGSSVSTSNNYAVIGVPGDNANTGSVNLYAYSGYSWSFVATLTSPSLAPGDQYGYAVDLFVADSSGNIGNGDVLIVGAPGNGTGVGKAFIYTYSNGSWTNERQLNPTGLLVPSYFGSSVAINQNMAVVGAPGANSNKGTARYFRGSSGNYIAESFVDPPASVSTGDQFGFAVSVSGTTFVVSAPMGTGNQLVQFYTAPSGGAVIGPALTGTTTNAQFGYSLDLSANSLIVGSPGAASAKGSALIYGYTISSLGALTTSTPITLTAPSTASRFGESVSIYTDSLAVVGQFSTSGTNSGKAFIYPGPIFSNANSVALPKVSNNANDQFGAAVSIFGGSIMVGAPNDNNVGASFLYRNDQ